MVVAKLVGEKLNIHEKDFIKGNLLPDIIKNPQSHHKKKGKYYFIPDISFFKRTLNLNNPLELGYFTHLLLDKYFLEEYLPQDVKMFENKTIYREYDLVNYQLVKKFSLNTNYIKKVLNEIDFDIDAEKLLKNIQCLENKEIGETKYINFATFSSFLYHISQKISKEVEEYAN